MNANVYEVLSVAVTKGVRVFLDGDNLAFRAPPGAMTQDLRTAIAACKPELIAHLRAKPKSFVTSAIPRTNIPLSEPAPLSASQQQYWMLNRLLGPSSQYNTHLALRRQGDLDMAALSRALKQVFDRHPALRLTFPLIAGEPRAVTAADAVLPLSRVDLRHYLPEVQQHAIQRLTRDEQLTPFDQSTGPLLRFLVITLADDSHLILWTQHHIMTDAWSVQLFLRELNLFYEAHALNRPISVPLPQVLYADYARWQGDRHKFADHESSCRWWKEHLAELPALNLAQATLAPSQKATEGDDVSFLLDASLTARIDAFAVSQKSTPYTAMLAAWTTLLHRYSSQTDFAVGTTTHGRTVPELHNVMGSFANAVPMRCDFSGEPTVTEVMSRTRAELRSALEHELPFVDVTRAAAQSSRYNGLNPIFQTNFTFESIVPTALAGASAADGPGRADGEASAPPFRLSLNERVNGGTPGTTKYDLALVLMKEAEGIRGSLQYSTALFQPAFVERISNHLGTIIAEMVAKPTLPVSKLDLLAPAERQSILTEWNGTEKALGDQRCLQELFEAQVERRPDHDAVVADEETLTFRELNRRANRLAHHLIERGVDRETLVGICMATRRVELVVAMLAVMKAGGAYVPIDTRQPRGRVPRLLADLGVSIAITDEPIVDALRAERIAPIHVDDDAADIERQPDTSPQGRARPENLVYVLFTSGSTGKPKGVAVEHRQLTNYLRAVFQRMALPDDCTYAHVSSFAAGLGHTVLFPPLCFGGTLHLINQQMATDPEGLGDYFSEQGIDCIKIVPSHLSALMSGAHPARLLPRKLLVVGGGPLTAPLLRQIKTLAPNLRVLNHYGSTEVTVGVLTRDAYQPVSGAATANVPLGRPLANNRVYVVDAALQPVPVGTSGELLIAGAQVGRGYIGSEVPADKFIPDPFAATPDARAYRTGDLVRQLESGEIEFLGRIDSQLKIRGFRVEPGEIEAALLTHPNVKASVVAPFTDGDAAPRLVAYVVRQSEPLSAAELQTFLRGQLPTYMMPSQFVFLDGLPLGSNGKIDRRKLSPPADVEATVGNEEAPVKPRTPTEILIARIWSDVLKVEQPDVNTDFFDAGGDSLLVLSVHNRLQEACGCEVALVDLLDNRTIQSLAQKVSALEEEAARGHGQKMSREAKLLVEVRRGLADQPPLFLIQSAHGGGPAEYVHLASHLSAERPVYALRQPADGLDHCIERLAARYLAELRGRWPKGPYLLGGASFGGLVAYEIAQQLRHQGDQVGALLLFDSIEPGQFPPAADERSPVDAPRDYRGLRSRYKPAPYQGDLTLFRAKDSEAHAFVGQDGGWASLVRGQLAVMETPGGHFTMLVEPNVRVLAEQVESLLKAAAPDRAPAAGIDMASGRFP